MTGIFLVKGVEFDTLIVTVTESCYGKAAFVTVTESDVAGMFPVSGADFEALNAAVERLTLNDASVAVKRENSAALGAGFRCGYDLLRPLDAFVNASRSITDAVAPFLSQICLLLTGYHQKSVCGYQRSANFLLHLLKTSIYPGLNWDIVLVPVETKCQLPLLSSMSCGFVC